MELITVTQPVATLLVGILTVVVTIGGWIAVHRFTVRREMQARFAADARADRVKRLEILLKHAESQISEFYGPVHGLIHQIWATWEVKQSMKEKLDSDTYNKVDHYIGERYFSSLHDRIRTILRERMHLLDGAVMPDSFYKYIQHSVMENIQINLWNEKQIDTLAVEGLRWPTKFPEDVKKGLEAAMRRYEEILAELRSTQNLTPTLH